MMDPLYYQYYDLIYSSKKDYKAEAETILKVFQEVAGQNPARILDVGCGSGGHAWLFAEKGYDVVGIDIDPAILEIARQKHKNGHDGAPPAFYCKEVNNLDAGEFSLVVSLFNVVNYIDRLDTLLQFFSGIYQKLAKRGVLIFDCWNGLAAILDLPKDKDTDLVVGNDQITIATRPQVSLMQQQVVVDNSVTIVGHTGQKAQFSYSYRQFLWTPWNLQDVLQMIGFDVLSISAWMQPTIPATSGTWKIMFVCQKT